MAMFNILATCNKTENINDVLIRVSDLPRNVVSVFPVISSDLKTFNSIGITVSGKETTNLYQIKEELVTILNFLWNEKFEIKELYNGKVINKETFKYDLDYFWNLPHQL